jgi:hypothetical protein
MFEFIHHPEYGCRKLKELRPFSLYFHSYMQPCGWKCPRHEGHRAQKIVYSILIILVSHFFSSFLFDPWLCMALPSMWSLQSDYKVFEFFQEILQGPHCWSSECGSHKNNSTSLIIRNLEFKFEPWIWFKSDVHKTHPNKKNHVIFINFGEKKVTVKKNPKETKFDVWMF